MIVPWISIFFRGERIAKVIPSRQLFGSGEWDVAAGSAEVTKYGQRFKIEVVTNVRITPLKSKRRTK